MPIQDCYLQFEGVGKSFPGVRALDGVSFGVREGSVHALVGENGAGKSTLLKILSGAHPPSEGIVRIGGAPHVFRSTAEAHAAGVAVIYQELHLVPEMSVAENLYLGHLPSRGGWVDQRRLRDDARGRIAALGENIDPGAKVGRLPIGQRQMVEIAKALTRSAKILAFDEPTSSLSDREVRALFAIIADLKARGHVILYVSHRLGEIFRVCDSVTVFRDGRHVETFDDISAVSADVLVNRMVGRDIHDIYGYRPRAALEQALPRQGVPSRVRRDLVQRPPERPWGPPPHTARHPTAIQMRIFSRPPCLRTRLCLKWTGSSVRACSSPSHSP